MSKLDTKKKVNIRGLIKQLKKKDYIVYDKPFQLNIVGVRANTTVPNKFDDIIYVFFKNDKNKWVGKAYPATTDTGTYWLKNPMRKSGSALLKEGQYVDTWIRRGHGVTKYLALGQEKPVTVYRDYNRDAVLDFANGREETGLFGINIHRAKKVGKASTVDKYSAGCQVFQDVEDFNEFMEMTKKHAELYGNKFTYSLIDERAYVRAMRRYAAYIGVGVALVAGYIGFRTYKNKPIIPKL